MENNIPIILYIDESLKNDFDRLLEKDSPIKGNKRVFIMAMMKGFAMKNRMKLKKRKDFVRVEYLSSEEKSIIKALSLAETKDLNIYSSPKEIYLLAEEYASGGIKYLIEEIFGKQHGTYIKRLESQLIEEFNKIAKKT
jgi:hypothetical protein